MTFEAAVESMCPTPLRIIVHLLLRIETGGRCTTKNVLGRVDKRLQP